MDNNINTNSINFSHVYNKKVNQMNISSVDSRNIKPEEFVQRINSELNGKIHKYGGELIQNLSKALGEEKNENQNGSSLELETKIYNKPSKFYIEGQYNSNPEERTVKLGFKILF
ncbi:MAG: hypothetical protein RMJ36_06400 [Candidatus Calescibacterium sp.]|nr:hypothetical protein [Candidatus Calescibacterium sp.]MDW8133266.1 hypothetical protein [Candidatus Calescibacterium sp.]